MDASEELTRLDPAYIKALRADAALFSLFLLGPALIGEAFSPLPRGVIVGAVGLLCTWLVLVVPGRRYPRWGYLLGEDRLRIASGWLLRRDTVVPLGRVQHIDVNQGPVARHYGLATLTVHTAGTLNSSVALPGLRHDQALAMRETIRAHIKAAQA